MFVFPLTSFEGWMLTMMNIASIQLHPNSWAFFKSFQLLCEYLHIQPIVNKFMYFYELNQNPEVDGCL